MSIIDPATCGFMRVAMFELSIENSNKTFKSLSVVEVSKSLKVRFERFIDLFKFCKGEDVKYDWYRRNINRIKKTLHDLGKASPEKKKKIISLFGMSVWSELNEKQKAKHCIFNCRECLKSYSDGLRLFSHQGDEFDRQKEN